MSKVSVIIAIYNTEKYLERCIRSLLEQTLDDIEYIFINDASTDNSLSILNMIVSEYPNRQDSIKIINLPHNKGLAKVRTLGMKNATSDYVIHCDSDDWVERNLYELMYNKAIETHADIVMSDYYYVTDDKQILITQCNNVVSSIPADFIKSTKHFFFGVLWNKLIKRNIYVDNNIYPYPELSFDEDLSVTYRCFFYGKKIATINGAYYYYNGSNVNSLTHQTTEKNWASMDIALQRLSVFLDEKGGAEYKLAKHFLQFSQKQVLLYNPSFINKWRTVYSKSHLYIHHYKLYTTKEKILLYTATISSTLYRLYNKIKQT